MKLQTSSDFSKTQQLTLPVRRVINRTFDSFYASKNKSVSDILQNEILNESSQFVYLLGPSDSGKTHLLEAVVSHLEHANDDRAIYVCLNELAHANLDSSEYSEFFDGLVSYRTIALDNLDQWFLSSCLAPEMQATFIFNLYNAALENGITLIISASCDPSSLACCLPDLISRLKSGLTLRLISYSDKEKISIIKSLAHTKGLSFNDDVASYIIKRSSRGLAALVEILAILDSKSLTEKRKLTIPFIKKTLNW